MEIYIADFTIKEPIMGEKNIENYRIDAKNKEEAKRQIKEWFDVMGDIRIIKEEN